MISRHIPLVVLLYLVQSSSGLAGYRTINESTPVNKMPSKAQEAVNWAKPVEPPGGWVEVEIKKDPNKDSKKLGNHNGITDRYTLEPLEELKVHIRKKDLPADATIFVYTIHGGRVNGEISSTVTAEHNGGYTFMFKAGRYPGNYPVVVSYGGREEVIEFWVEAAQGKAAGEVQQ